MLRAPALPASAAGRPHPRGHLLVHDGRVYGRLLDGILHGPGGRALAAAEMLPRGWGAVQCSAAGTARQLISRRLWEAAT